MGRLIGFKMIGPDSRGLYKKVVDHDQLIKKLVNINMNVNDFVAMKKRFDEDFKTMSTKDKEMYRGKLGEWLEKIAVTGKDDPHTEAFLQKIEDAKLLNLDESIGKEAASIEQIADVEKFYYEDVFHSTIIAILEYEVSYKDLKFYARDLNMTAIMEVKFVTINGMRHVTVEINRQTILEGSYSTDTLSTNMFIMLGQLDDDLAEMRRENEESI